MAAICSRQNSFVTITIVKPRYCSPRFNERRIASAVSRVLSFVNGWVLSRVEHFARVASRTRSRNSRDSGTTLNAAVDDLFDLASSAGGLRRVVTGSPLSWQAAGRGGRA